MVVFADIENREKTLLEVDLFADDHERFFADLGVDRPYVFADDTQEKDLDPAEKQDQQSYGG